MPLSIFGFQALWSPVFFMVVVFMSVLYFIITTKMRSKFKNSEPLQTKQAVYFVIAMILLYVVKGSPIDLLSHIMFSVHMVQMSTLFYIMTPLLMLSLPNWLWAFIINLPIIKRIFRFFTNPVIAVLLFNIVFSIYHIPLVFDGLKKSGSLHSLFMIVLFLLAVFMWWPLINKVEGQRQLNGLKKICYIIVGAVLLTPACALLIFVGKPIFATYADGTQWLQAMKLCVPPDTLSNLNLSGPELFSPLSVVDDQQLGGVIMKIVQEIVFAVVLFNVFFEWFRKDQAEGEKFTEAAMLSHNTQTNK